MAKRSYLPRKLKKELQRYFADQCRRRTSRRLHRWFRAIGRAVESRHEKEAASQAQEKA